MKKKKTASKKATNKPKARIVIEFTNHPTNKKIFEIKVKNYGATDLQKQHAALDLLKDGLGKKETFMQKFVPSILGMFTAASFLGALGSGQSKAKKSTRKKNSDEKNKTR